MIDFMDLKRAVVRVIDYQPVDVPLPSNRQHLGCDDCLEVRRENNQNCFALSCV